jgi:hypothetical protein
MNLDEEASKALRGERIKIEGFYTFTVDFKGTVIAQGPLIIINKPDGQIWKGEDTGENGEAVYEGCTVRVLNTHIQFLAKEIPSK